MVIPDDMLSANGAISTKEAKQFADEARRDGYIPMKSGQAAQINLIAESVLCNEDARPYLEASSERELSMFETHPDGTPMRCRFDLLTEETRFGRAAVDLKTAAGSADLEPFVKDIQSYGYHIQDVWYEETAALVGVGDLRFVFIVVSKRPPYMVGVYTLDPEFISLGRDATAKARRVWLECTNSGKWPGLPSGVRSAAPLPWFVMQQEDLEIQV